MANMQEWFGFTGIPGIPFTGTGSPAQPARLASDRRSSRRVKIPAVGDYFIPQIQPPVSQLGLRPFEAIISPAFKD